jgi:hypothetical protein
MGSRQLLLFSKRIRPRITQIWFAKRQQRKLSGFVYGNCKIVAKESSGLDEIHVEVTARNNSKARCGQCGKPGPTYDTRKERSFQFVPTLGSLNKRNTFGTRTRKASLTSC